MNLAPGSVQAWLREVYPEVERTLTCDSCEGECSEPYGDENNVLCCGCYARSAQEFGPASYRVSKCPSCEKRVEK